MTAPIPGRPTGTGTGTATATGTGMVTATAHYRSYGRGYRSYRPYYYSARYAYAYYDGYAGGYYDGPATITTIAAIAGPRPRIWASVFGF